MKTALYRYLKVIRIFIASPSDIIAERKLFPTIIERTNNIKAKSQGLILEPVGWEYTLPGNGRPQEKINEAVKRSDLIVMLLWKKWGSPTGNFSSGFEEEYNVACSERKEIWLYLRQISVDMLDDPGAQIQKVWQFREKVKAEKKILYKKYEDENIWKDIFIDDLCQWIDKLICESQMTESSIIHPANCFENNPPLI